MRLQETMLMWIELKKEIFQALVYLDVEREENPRNTLVWVVDRSGSFHFYYTANSVFFWEGKSEIDFIEMVDNSEAFWGADDRPESPDDIEDEIEEYLIQIREHVHFALQSGTPSIYNTAKKL